MKHFLIILALTVCGCDGQVSVGISAEKLPPSMVVREKHLVSFGDGVAYYILANLGGRPVGRCLLGRVLPRAGRQANQGEVEGTVMEEFLEELASLLEK